MPVPRDDPYGAFNYLLTVSGLPENAEVRGGFSEISGLNTEVTYADYREGTDEANRPRKIPLTYKAGDITLKRGLIGRKDLWNWVDLVRKGNQGARINATIALRAEDGSPEAVSTWQLKNARPSKWTGPTLTAQGGSEVAMEELTLVCEDIVYEE